MNIFWEMFKKYLYKDFNFLKIVIIIIAIFVRRLNVMVSKGGNSCLLLWFSFGLFLILPKSVFSQKNIYVRPSYATPFPGNNSNSGTSWHDAYASIQYALSHANTGDVIYCDAGIWKECLEVLPSKVKFKAVALIGKGPGKTIVKADGAKTASITFMENGKKTIGRHVLLVAGSYHIYIEGFTLDGDHKWQKPTPLPYGAQVWTGLKAVYFRDQASGVLVNCDLKGCSKPGLSNEKGNVCARISNSAYVVFRNCFFYDFDKCGLFAANSKTKTIIEDSYFLGAGPTNIVLQYGIKNILDSELHVRHTSFRNFMFTGSLNNSSAIYIKDHGSSSSIEDCKIFSSDIAININSEDENDDISVTGNIISGCIKGISIEKSKGIIYGNTFVDVTYPAWDGGNNPPSSTNFSKWYFGDQNFGWGNHWWDIEKNPGFSAGKYNIPNGGNNILLQDIHPTKANRSGSFSTPSSYSFNQGITKFVLADFTGDGIKDIAVLNSSHDYLKIYPGKTPYGFRSTPVFSLVFPSGSQPIYIVSGEFSGTPGIDFAVAFKNTGEVRIYKNTGTGTFALIKAIDLDGPNNLGNLSWMATNKIDGDNNDDIIAVLKGTPFTSSSGIKILLSKSHPSFSPISLSPPAGSSFGLLGEGTIFDMDDDGIKDLAICECPSRNNTNKRILIYKGISTSPFFVATSKNLNCQLKPTCLLNIDINLDAKKDLLIGLSNSPFLNGKLILLKRTGAFSFSTTDTVQVGPGLFKLLKINQTKRNEPGNTNLRYDILAVHLGSASIWQLSIIKNKLWLTQAIKNGYVIGGIASEDLNSDAIPELIQSDALSGKVFLHKGKLGLRLKHFGKGCPGTYGPPILRTYGNPGLPYIPNPTFGIVMGPTSPSTIGVIGFGLLLRTPLPSSRCNILLQNIDIAYIVCSCGKYGESLFALPIPNIIDIIGAKIYVQGAFLDVRGRFLGALSLTEGLEIVLDIP